MAKHKHEVAVKNIEVKLTKRDKELGFPLKTKYTFNQIFQRKCKWPAQCQDNMWYVRKYDKNYKKIVST